jgi:hypothetical protein
LERSTQQFSGDDTMSEACPDNMEKVCEMPSNKNEEWRSEPGRTPTFQAFLDSLESKSVRRAENKVPRPMFGNFATKRE